MWMKWCFNYRIKNKVFVWRPWNHWQPLQGMVRFSIWYPLQYSSSILVELKQSIQPHISVFVIYLQHDYSDVRCGAIQTLAALSGHGTFSNPASFDESILC